jgi:large subunit ribosomal protein L28
MLASISQGQRPKAAGSFAGRRSCQDRPDRYHGLFNRTRDPLGSFPIMGMQCEVCGKKPVVGNQYTIRGKAKYLGGVGRKPTGISKRLFKPNLQTIQCQVGGSVKTMRVCVKCIRSGLVQRPIKRKAFTMPTNI